MRSRWARLPPMRTVPGQRRLETGDRTRPVAFAIGGETGRELRHHLAGRRTAGGGALLEFRHDGSDAVAIVGRDTGQRTVHVDEGDAGLGKGLQRVVARLAPQRFAPRLPASSARHRKAGASVATFSAGPQAPPGWTCAS